MVRGHLQSISPPFQIASELAKCERLLLQQDGEPSAAGEDAEQRQGEGDDGDDADGLRQRGKLRFIGFNRNEWHKLIPRN